MGLKWRLFEMRARKREREGFFKIADKRHTHTQRDDLSLFGSSLSESFQHKSSVVTGRHPSPLGSTSPLLRHVIVLSAALVLSMSRRSYSSVCTHRNAILDGAMGSREMAGSGKHSHTHKCNFIGWCHSNPPITRSELAAASSGITMGLCLSS